MFCPGRGGFQKLCGDPLAPGISARSSCFRPSLNRFKVSSGRHWMRGSECCSLCFHTAVFVPTLMQHLLSSRVVRSNLRENHQIYCGVSSRARCIGDAANYQWCGSYQSNASHISKPHIVLSSLGYVQVMFRSPFAGASIASSTNMAVCAFFAHINKPHPHTLSSLGLHRCVTWQPTCSLCSAETPLLPRRT